MTLPASVPISVADVIAYFCRAYPHKDELSNARLTKLVYLADWHSAQRRDRQLTPIHWLFNHYGPWVPDVLDAARHDSVRFVVKHEQNAYGSSKTLIALTARGESTVERGALTAEDHAIIDGVIAETERMYFGQFIDYVYKTYPVAASTRYESLDLQSLAAQERAETGQDLRQQDAQLSRPAPTEHGGIDAERFAELRATIHAAVSAELGADLASQMSSLYPDLQSPTLQSIESTYDLKVKRSGPDDFEVTVDVEGGVEGFIFKGDYYGDEESYTLLDGDWNDHMMWVSIDHELTFTFHVEADESDEGGWFRADLLKIAPMVEPLL